MTKHSPHFRPSFLRACSFSAALFFTGLGLVQPQVSWAENHTGGVPALNSRPGAEYTIYLDMAGFNYTGSWSEFELGTPGFTPSVGDVASNATFSPSQVTELNNIWSRVAQSYIGFNINVTTVDPAILAGQASTDASRQAFYDATPNLMHTVVGSQERSSYITGTNPTGKWYSTGADGVSGLGVVAGVSDHSGSHTNWMFTEDQQGVGFINGDYIGAISSHENAHAFGLSHQGDWTGNTKVNEYSNGDVNAGNGSYVPIIGGASDRQRVAWRVGDTSQDTHTVVNDVKQMLLTDTAAAATLAGRAGGANLHLVNDGIGHTRTAATPLALRPDGTVNFSLSSGVIVPSSESNPLSIGAANYTQDWFSFTLALDSTVTLVAHDGTQFLTAGVADGVGTLRSTLALYQSNGDFLANASEDPSTLFETYSGMLAAGSYYALVGSYGGHVQDSPDYNAATYFDMGAYFLTGTGFTPTPEPGSVMFLIAGGAMMLVRRSRRH